MPGTVVRRYREMKNYSQKYVASQMGISQNAYSKIENNLTQLTVHHVKQLSEILEVPMNDLLRDEFEIHKPLFIQGKTIQKEDVVAMLEHIKQKLNANHTSEHESYLMSMSLLSTVNNLVSDI
jgi:transcriptional regulator with XRE-family HTH domain